MGILCAICSLPISILLIRWSIRKKIENPFQKGDVRRLIIAGMLSMLLSVVVTLVVMVVRAYNLIGADTLKNWMTNPDVDTILKDLEAIREKVAQRTYWTRFVATFLSVGLVEEVSRYLFLRLFTRKKEFAKTRFDLVICGGIVGVGFQLLEDLLYVNGNLISAIFRAITPFHFTFGAIMGYFVGKSLETGNKGYSILAILIPALLHTLFDSSVTSILYDDWFLVLFLFSAALLIGLTIFMIVRINKWARELPAPEAQE